MAFEGPGPEDLRSAASTHHLMPPRSGRLEAWLPDLLSRIVVDPAICFGKPTIHGHRIWVSLILGYLAEGWTVEAIIDEFPGIEPDDIRACIAYGARLADMRFADLDDLA